MSNYPDSLIAPLRDKNWLTSSISEVTGVEPAKVRERLNKEYLNIPMAVPTAFYAQNLTPFVYNEGMIHFYEETDAFMYELLAWNSTLLKCTIRGWTLNCLRRNGLTSGKILICGDGIGIDSFYFAQNGFEITSFEVSKFGVAFMEKMFHKYGVEVKISGSLEELPEGSFDAILCLDVLEHLPDPVAAVCQSSKLLRPGGFFIHSSPFYLIQPRWATHLASNRKLAGQVQIFEKNAGLKMVDSRFLQNPIVFQKNGGTPVEKLSFLKRLFLWYGSGWLMIFGHFPKIMPHFILKIFRNDPHLKELAKD